MHWRAERAGAADPARYVSGLGAPRTRWIARRGDRALAPRAAEHNVGSPRRPYARGPRDFRTARALDRLSRRPRRTTGNDPVPGPRLLRQPRRAVRAVDRRSHALLPA